MRKNWCQEYAKMFNCVQLCNLILELARSILAVPVAESRVREMVIKVVML